MRHCSAQPAVIPGPAGKPLALLFHALALATLKAFTSQAKVFHTSPTDQCATVRLLVWLPSLWDLAQQVLQDCGS